MAKLKVSKGDVVLSCIVIGGIVLGASISLLASSESKKVQGTVRQNNSEVIQEPEYTEEPSEKENLEFEENSESTNEVN